MGDQVGRAAQQLRGLRTVQPVKNSEQCDTIMVHGDQRRRAPHRGEGAPITVKDQLPSGIVVERIRNELKCGNLGP